MSARIFDDDQIGKEARIAIRGQRHRCDNPNASDYKYYGGKGIKVKYTSEGFFKWFKKKRKNIPLNIKVNVDRLHHDKNYSLDNIRLITKVDNVIESNTRRAKLTIDVALKHRKKGLTYKEIGELCGICATAVGSLFRKNGFRVYQNNKIKGKK